jgi:hypothetical protein
MSTASPMFADNFTDTPPAVARRKKRQTPYKPRLASTVKAVMEESVEETIKAQEIMSEIAAWSKMQRTLSNDLLKDISQLAPLDHRMQMLLHRNTDLLLRQGELDNFVLALGLLVSAMERKLTATLINSRVAIAPPSKLSGKEA